MRRITQRGSRRSTGAMSRPMTNRLSQETSPTIATLDDLAKLANYSLMDTLNCDPDAKADGADHALVFDDARAAPEPLEALRGAQAYLLFYERERE